jgi:cell division septal protein FtsQ
MKKIELIKYYSVTGKGFIKVTLDGETKDIFYEEDLEKAMEFAEQIKANLENPKPNPVTILELEVNPVNA